MEKVQLLKDFCGTHHYAAPEILRKKPYDGQAADIWACGVVLYSMVCGCLPFSNDNPELLSEAIFKAKPSFPKHLSLSVRDLIESILKPEPIDRPSVVDITEHRWFPKKETPRTRGIINHLKRTSSGLLSQTPNPSIAVTVRPPTSPRLQYKVDSKKARRKIVPPYANAFEIIGWSGVFDISKILLQAMGPTSIKAKTKTQFVTEEKNLTRFVNNIEKAIMTVNQENNAITFKFDHEKSKAKIYDEEGLSGYMQLYTLAPQLYLVDFVQEEGSEEEWYKLYRIVYKFTTNDFS